MFKGIAVSPGLGIGKAYIINEPYIKIDKGTIIKECIPKEIKKLKEAIDSSIMQLNSIFDSAMSRGEKEKGEIIKAHLMILKDPVLFEETEESIRTMGIKAEYALTIVIERQTAIFESINDDYIKERIRDIKDIGLRILKNLKGMKIKDLSVIREEVILVGKEITPSQMAAVDSKFVKGLVFETGSMVSHTAILARNTGIPAITGITDAAEFISEGQLVIVDGLNGTVEIAPNEVRIEETAVKINESLKLRQQLSAYRHIPTVTLDGRRIKLECNVEGKEGIKKAVEVGSEGIGLYRTEFLFMDRNSPPNEEEQYRAYREAAESMSGKPVIIRTLDVGGDKKIEYLNLPKEENPFLGFRAIRLCFERLEMFKTQLRSILRASAHGKVKIMFPMIATLEELKKAKGILEDVKSELGREGYDYDKSIETGIMIEIPSAAIIADHLAKEADFFSIGTNDLTQYVLAADRTNEKVNYLYNNYDLSVIRLIASVVKAGHKNNIPVGMCGEFAGDPKAALLLLGIGLDELSMSPEMLLRIRKLINSTEIVTAAKIAKKALRLESSKQIEDYLDIKYKELKL